MKLNYATLGGLIAVGLVISSCKKELPVIDSEPSSPITLTEIPLNGCPESVARYGDRFFISVIGKDAKPMFKDSDGYIVEVDINGKVIKPNAFPKVMLHAPKGMTILGDTLFVTDIDRIVPINLKNNRAGTPIDFTKEKVAFLNDLSPNGKGGLFASATDVSKIYDVDITNGSFKELKTSKNITGANGLTLSPDGKSLYAAGFAMDTEGKGTGQIWSIALKDGTATPIGDVTGQLDGISTIGDYILYTDWEKNGQPGTLSAINLKNNNVQILTKIPLKGPADFLIDAENNTIWLPAMLDKKIIKATLPPM